MSKTCDEDFSLESLFSLNKSFRHDSCLGFFALGGLSFMRRPFLFVADETFIPAKYCLFET